MGPAPGNIIPDKTAVHTYGRLEGKGFRFGFFFQPSSPEYPRGRNGMWCVLVFQKYSLALFRHYRSIKPESGGKFNGFLYG
jgi:hypothetical protein